MSHYSRCPHPTWQCPCNPSAPGSDLLLPRGREGPEAPWRPGPCFLVWRPHRHSRAIWGSASGASSFTRMGAPGGQRSCLRGPLSPECLRQCLAWSRCSASVCKMSEWHRMASYQQVGTRSQIPRSRALGLSSRAGSSALRPRSPERGELAQRKCWLECLMSPSPGLVSSAGPRDVPVQAGDRRVPECASCLSVLQVPSV